MHTGVEYADVQTVRLHQCREILVGIVGSTTQTQRRSEAIVCEHLLLISVKIQSRGDGEACILTIADPGPHS